MLEDLNPTGREVATLALEAADEIDDLSLGKDPEPRATLKLAKGLKGSFVQSENPVVPKHFIDSETVAVLCNALGHSGWGSEVATIGDLVLKAKEISEALEKVVYHRNKADLDRARDFCVALANASSSFRQSVYELRPPNPFRS